VCWPKFASTRSTSLHPWCKQSVQLMLKMDVQLYFISFLLHSLRMTRIHADLPAIRNGEVKKQHCCRSCAPIRPWCPEIGRYELIASWKLTLLFAWFGCTSDSKDTTRHANKMTCTSWSISNVVSGLVRLHQGSRSVVWENTWHELQTTLLGGCMQCKPWNQMHAAIDFQGWATSGTQDFLWSILRLPHP